MASSRDAPDLGGAPFGCLVHRHGRSAEIDLDGELDLAARPTLDDALDTALSFGALETVVVDLTRVTFADSTTLSWLVEANTRAGAAGARLIAVVESGPVHDILAITGLDKVLTVVPDRRDIPG
jgi:anti-anti-sigma factor